MAHATIAPATFAFLMPVGAILIRTVRGGTWLHAGWMSFCYCALVVQLGLGLWMAVGKNQLDEFHCQIGIVVVTLLLIQPFTGYLHHRLFKARSRRTAVSYLHVFWGIALITLGIINCGLGLQLSHEKKQSTYIVFGTLAGVVWFVWMATSAVAQIRRRGASPSADDEKADKPSPLPTPTDKKGSSLFRSRPVPA